MATKKTAKTAKAKSNSNNKSGRAGGDSMLREFFIDELKDIFWAENHLLKVLPKMQKAVSCRPD